MAHKTETFIELENDVTLRGVQYRLWGAIYSTTMSGTHFYAVFNAEDVVRTKGTYSFDDIDGNQFLCCMIAFKVLKKNNRTWEVDIATFRQEKPFDQECKEPLLRDF